MPSAWSHSGFLWACGWAPRPAVLVGREQPSWEFQGESTLNISCFENSSAGSATWRSSPPPTNRRHTWQCENCHCQVMSLMSNLSIMHKLEKRWRESGEPQKAVRLYNWENKRSLSCDVFKLLYLTFCFLLQKGECHFFYYGKCVTFQSLLYLPGSFVKWTRWNHQKLKGQG